jgi:hypothetical protein
LLQLQQNETVADVLAHPEELLDSFCGIDGVVDIKRIYSFVVVAGAGDQTQGLRQASKCCTTQLSPRALRVCTLKSNSDSYCQIIFSTWPISPSTLFPQASFSFHDCCIILPSLTRLEFWMNTEIGYQPCLA